MSEKAELFVNKIRNSLLSNTDIPIQNRKYHDDVAAYKFDRYLSSCGYVLLRCRIKREPYAG